MMHLLLSLMLACTTDPPPAAVGAPAATIAAPGAVDVAGLRAATAQGAVVIDVRTDDEYNSGHVPGARHIPLSDLPSTLDQLNDLKDKDVYLICAAGGRSARAAQLLAAEGFQRPINVEGGTNAWREAGYPLD